MLVSVVLLGACGSGGSASTTTTSAAPTDVATVVLGPFRAAGGTDAQAVTLLAAGCAALAPADRYPDAASLNDYFTDLFDGDPGGGGVRRDRHEVDQALEDACRAHAGDVDAFLTAVATALALGPADVQRAIDSACDGYETRLRTNAGDGYAPQPLDDRVLTVLAVAGIDRSQAEAMIEEYCGPM